MADWTTKDIPNQTGKVVIVTGGNSGLGYESVLALAQKGATVIMASRDQSKALTAINRITQQVPQAQIEFQPLDLASLASIQAFASNFKATYKQLDILINNAGISTNNRQETTDGFEMHFGVNHLGHFALTGLLLELLLATPESRVVTTTSVLQTVGWINFDDLQLKRSFTRLFAYGQSKLANMLFALELDRRLRANNASTISVAAHPGYSNTQMTQGAGGTFGTFLEDMILRFANELIAQSAAMGALPQLYAATAPDVKGGELYGPQFFTHGYPMINPATVQAYDEQTAQRLWEASEKLTGVAYEFEKHS